jgi:orotate phosphoribosyltransferase-like protein
MNDELIKKINNLREEGHSMRNIANECDVSTTIVQKAIKNTVRNTNSRVI